MTTCPRCGSKELYAWRRPGLIIFACADCHARWEIPIHRVDRLIEELEAEEGGK